jgi:hypothetical protein
MADRQPFNERQRQLDENFQFICSRFLVFDFS